jgi:crotonobetainyl-CoA:carnitine CoA-transferase CaiB-like acyl-CoA transferase
VKERIVTRPFEGIKIIDLTHVLAGPFAAYQLGVLGADVIKVENPDDCDQSRHTGDNLELNRRDMGTNYLAQNSNKRAITLNLKTEKGRDILKRMARDADVLIENYRAGAFPALGIGYQDMKKINPRLIYCSMTAFGHDGPRGTHTAYDHAIQATSGIMAMTGTPEVNPLKTGAPVIDYSTGTMAAFAIASALFQRERTGSGQHIDCSMLDVALMLEASHIAGFMSTGKSPKPKGNSHAYASSYFYETKQGQIMLAASNHRQHTRLFAALGRPEMGNKDYEYRRKNFHSEAAELQKIMMEKTAQEWEDYLQANHVPALRVRSMPEALADPQVKTREILHRHEHVPGVEGPMTVPMCAFKYEHGGPSIETPPPRLGEHNADVLASLGYSAADIAALHEEGVV